ncbi:MAG: SagB/ThcOx family dehydrogenase [Pseudomonadota bacterium]
MKDRSIWALLLTMLLTAAFTSTYAEGPASIALPQPGVDGGKPLMQALKERKSARDFSEAKLTPQVLSDLLWAAYGVNRPESGRRTAPSSYNKQEIDVYAATADGLFLYDPKAHGLVQVSTEDIRALTGRQTFVKTAPLNLIYVADLTKMGDGEEADKLATSAANTGFIGQNVYLFCASEGLATVFRAGIDKEKLAAAMKLRPDQRITYSQTVGYPK